MNLWEFVQKHIKTKVDFDGAYGAQCVDLFRQYCKDVLEIPHTGAVNGAKDLVEQYDKLPLEKKYFFVVKDKYTAQSGDVAVWGATKTNKYGHVAIVLKANARTLLVFEQDGFRQDGARLAERSTDGIIGYLRAFPNDYIGMGRTA